VVAAILENISPYGQQRQVFHEIEPENKSM
jgi:hypothetical protein